MASVQQVQHETNPRIFACETCKETFRTSRGLLKHKSSNRRVCGGRPRVHQRRRPIVLEVGRITKHRRGVPYSSDLKQKMLNAYWGFMRDNHPSLKRNGYAFTARVLQVSVRKIREALKEVAKTGQVRDTTRVHRSVNTVAAQLSPEMRIWVQESIHDMYSKLQSQSLNSISRHTYPTVSSIQNEVSKHPDFPAMSTTAFFYLLKTIGFQPLKKNKARDCMMIEDPRIIKRRRQYLEDKFKFMAEQRPIFYVDESYVLADHSVPRRWCDTNFKSSYEAKSQGLTVGCPPSKNKGNDY